MNEADKLQPLMDSTILARASYRLTVVRSTMVHLIDHFQHSSPAIRISIEGLVVCAGGSSLRRWRFGGSDYSVRAAQTNSGKLVRVVHDTVRRQVEGFQTSLEALRGTLKEESQPLRSSEEATRSRLLRVEEATRRNIAKMDTFHAVVGVVESIFTISVCMGCSHTGQGGAVVTSGVSADPNGSVLWRGLLAGD